MKLYILLFLMTFAVNAQQISTSKIEEVTVYLSGARVTRTAEFQVAKGANEILIKKLSPAIDGSSIQLSDLSGLRLLGLSYDIKASEEKSKSNNYQTIETRIDSVRSIFNLIDAKLTGLSEELLLLQSNRNLNSKDTGMTLTQVKSFGSYYNQRSEEIAIAKSKLSNDRAMINELLQNLIEDQKKIDPASNEMQGLITLKLYSSVSKIVSVIVTYNVGNAGWVPVYDLYANGKSNDIKLDFKGQIYQETGTDWKNVTLKLSTGDPNVDNTRPVLQQKKLEFVNYNYDSRATGRSDKRYNPTVRRVQGKVVDIDGTPILGATVFIKGTNTSTTTDFDGNYSLNVQGGRQLGFNYPGYNSSSVPIYASTINQKLTTSLDAVVVMGYRNQSDITSNITRKEKSVPEVVKTVEDNIASRSFELSERYSIPSTGETTDVNISNNTITAVYEYYVAPVINENVFLTAKLKDYERLNLIPGEANVYFEDGYTGKIYFDTDTTDEELIVSLGVDSQITIERKDVKDFQSTSFLGSTRILEKKFEITLKNNRKNAITLKVQDRIPVSTDNDIKVDKVEINEASLNVENNILTWMVDLSSGQQSKLGFSYRIKYPKGRRINED